MPLLQYQAASSWRVTAVVEAAASKAPGDRSTMSSASGNFQQLHCRASVRHRWLLEQIAQCQTSFDGDGAQCHHWDTVWSPLLQFLVHPAVALTGSAKRVCSAETALACFRQDFEDQGPRMSHAPRQALRCQIVDCTMIGQMLP